MIHSPVIILGAGPAGVAAALTLGKQNQSCLLLDKAVFPRDKICGDAISGKVVSVLNKIDPDIIKSFQKTPIQLNAWGVIFAAPNRKQLKVPFRQGKKQGEPPGYVSKRMDFDYFLLNQLRKYESVKIEEGVEITGFEKTKTGFVLTDKSGEARSCNLLIVANGAFSRFSKEFGGIKKDPGHYCGGVRAYFKNVKEMDKDNFIELHFLKEYLPGYFWIFPLPDGLANVGLGMRSDYVSKRRLDLKKSMLQIIGEHPAIRDRFTDAVMIDKIQGFGLPLGSKQRKISGGHFMLTGDAASLIDPFTGEGIGNAMLSGREAALQAMTCLKMNNFSANIMNNYDLAVYRQLGKELKLSYRMQQLSNFPGSFNLVVNKALKNKKVAELISSMFNDIDLRQKLRSPKFYFNLLWGK
jgi:geranylgeranyl reductase family protein